MTNETVLSQVKIRRGYPYAKRAPTFISTNVGGADEIARWVLDYNDVIYHDEPHAPYLFSKVANKLTGSTGPGNSPVLINTDSLIYSTDSLVQYYDQRNLPQYRLLPADPQKQREVLDLYRLFTSRYDDEVSRYVYSQLLSNKSYAQALFAQNVPFREKMACRFQYGSIAAAITKELTLGAKTPQEHLQNIKQVFSQVGDLLKDCRKYLCGDKLTLADIAFCAVSAPLLLPDEYCGAITKINQIPDGLRRDVEELRSTPAGQYVLRVYQADRPAKRSKKDIPKDPHGLAKIFGKLGESFGKNKAGLFYWLQKKHPVLKLPFVKLATVNRNDLLVEMLGRDEDFTVEEINSKKMSNQKGAFFLGWDRMNPQFDRERDFVRKSIKREDVELVRSLMRSNAEELIDHAKDFGRIDVANTVFYPTLVRLIDIYFGVPSPSETKMKKWLRALFYDLFLNFTNNAAKHQAAVDAALERKEWLLELIEDRKQMLKDGKTLDDNVFNRLILMQGQPGYEWVDDDVLQRNIGGLVTGILETTNKAAILVLDELFRRPDVLPGAIAAAKAYEMDKLYGYVAEALRFNPAQPGVIRYAEKAQVLTGKGTKKYTIPGKTKVFALTSAAMFDPAAFPDPKKFDPARKGVVYMNWGYGLHECHGKYINPITISELVGAVLRLPKVRRVEGQVGKGLKQGPFPTNFVVGYGEDDGE